MNDYDIKLDKEKLVALLSKKEGLSDLLEQVLNQVLESQMSEHLGADKYEHNNDRQGYRNGYRIRQLHTRVGSLNLRVPQTRDVASQQRFSGVISAMSRRLYWV